MKFSNTDSRHKTPKSINHVDPQQGHTHLSRKYVARYILMLKSTLHDDLTSALHAQGRCYPVGEKKTGNIHMTQDVQRSQFEDYPAHNGRNVIYAGLWLPETDICIVVEEDMDEALHIVRSTLVGLISIAIFLTISQLISQLISLLRTRRSLARSMRLLATFSKNSPVGMLLKSTDGRYLMTNPMFESVFRIPSGYAIGKTDDELFLPDEARIRRAEHFEVMRTGATFSKKYTTRNENEEELVFSVTSFPIRGENNSTIVAVGSVATDITELVMTQRKLEDLTHMQEEKVAERTRELSSARDTTEAKTKFLADMSHEIRTPLNAIMGMTHLATSINTAPRVEHYLERIQSSSQHLLGIVSNILDLSKIEVGKLQIEATEFSLEHMLKHVANFVWEQADAKGLELIISIESNIPDRLLADSLRISQILINFVSNAVKFTEKGEVILRVNSQCIGSDTIHLRFEVEDTGIGIANKKLPLLFTPFQQVNDQVTHRIEGTGLGLAISKNLAELMGGSVSVTSQLGFGSVFALDLELRMGNSTTAPIVPWIDKCNLSALVVDGNAPARAQLAKLLHALSFRVDEASNGNEAIDRIIAADTDNHSYDVVFTDGKMSGLNGMKIAEHIRQLSQNKKSPSLVLIASSAWNSTEPIERSRFDAVLNKPITFSDLFDIVTKLFSPMRMENMKVQSENRKWDCLIGQKVLLVEDNPINQEVIHDLLKIVGMQITIAGDGMQALRMLNNQAFDVILMDVHMPIMNGFETTAEIRKNKRFTTLPILALTANALGGNRERCLAVGMNDYIPKPVDPNQMFATLARNLPATISHTSFTPAEPPSNMKNSEDIVDLEILAALSSIPGLNYKLGIENMMGRVDLYTKLVRRMATEHCDFPQKMEAVLDAGNYEKIEDLIHDIKSILGALGAFQLYQRCLDLADLLHKGIAAVDDIKIFNEGFSELIKALVDATHSEKLMPAALTIGQLE